MTAVVRTPPEEDRAQIVELLRASLNFTQAWAEDRGPVMSLADYRCAYEGDRIVAAAAGFRFRQWFGGHDLPMSGIYAVATLPEHRGTGLASAAVLHVLRDAREEGMSASALFPAVLGPYRKLGYELGGTFSEHRLDLDAIPPDPADDLPVIEPLDPGRDLDAVKACYRDWVRHENGPLEPTDDLWWTRRILSPWGEAHSRAVVVRGREGSIEGFAAFRYAPAEGGHLDIDFGLECLAFATTTERATRALLSYFRSFRGVGLWVQWCGAPEDPIAMLVPEQKIATPFRFRWMFRLLDVRSALAERGYPAVDAEVVVVVEDPQFPENAGPWRLVVRGGDASVEPAPGAATRPLPIGVISSMFSGFLRVHDAVRMGYMDRNDPAVPALQQLLAGADPWCPFFF